MVSYKHIPHRTCVACGKISPKQELMRLVCIAGGSVGVDVSGKKVGRGAYLCQSPECWEIGLKGSRLERSLRVSLNQHNREQLVRFRKELKESNSGESK